MASSSSSLARAPIQQCTVYVSNLPFSLTNNDLHQIFQQFGPISKITIVKDRQTRKSKGVAFIVFEEETSTSKCIDEINQKQMFGRQLKASIAKDNGRSDEFAGQEHKKKPTTDPNSPRRCFECGQDGHLSYECPKNLLGVRPLPAGKKLKGPNNSRKTKYDSDASGDEDDEEDSLSAAIRCEQARRCGEASNSEAQITKKKKFKQSSYFSDEEELSD